MGVAGGTFEGIPCRLFRASFTGEVGCEINVPWGQGAALWEKLCERGAALGFMVYGTEAMHVLRAERGFIIVGQETDGTVTPHDLGLESMIGDGEARFRRQAFAGTARSARAEPQAAGRPPDRRRAPRLDEGAQLVADPREPIPMTALGHVTSSYYSANCGRSIAMALVAGGRARLGETVYATSPGGFAAAKMVPLPFLIAHNRRPLVAAAARPRTTGAGWLSARHTLQPLRLQTASDSQRAWDRTNGCWRAGGRFAGFQRAGRPAPFAGRRQPPLCRVAVEGDSAPLILAAGCPLDLHPDVLHRRQRDAHAARQGRNRFVAPGEAPSYRVECARSFAPYVALPAPSGARIGLPG